MSHTDKMFQILTPTGEVVGQLPKLSAGQLVEYYRWLVLGRLFSERMVALQRQGRMGTFAPLQGQEAASVGMAAPLQAGDWLLGSYREALAYLVKGVPFPALLKRWTGQITDGYPREAGCLPLQVILGTQMLHAVGIAQAIKYEKKPHVVVAACGDGATSEGDFNEALNFAGVFKVPIVFVVQNNGWAISTARKRQTAATHLADRGPAFGLPGYVVDGNDLLAVYQRVTECVDRARAGEGPSLIEAVTYRLGAHTTADDPTRYRSPEELASWLKRDPLIRFRAFLLAQSMLTEAEDKAVHQAATTKIQAAIEACEASPPPHPADLFETVYDSPSPQMKRQQAHLLKELGLE